MKKEMLVVLSSALSLFAKDAGEVSSSFQSKSAAAPCGVKEKAAPCMSRSGEILCDPQPAPTMLKSARFETGDGWDWSFNASFNEYYATQEGMEVAVLAIESGGYDDPVGPVLNFDCKYKPGFSAGFTLNTPYDKWVVGGEYLWFRSHTEASASTKDPLFYYSPFFSNALDTGFYSIAATWKLGIDMIDLYVNRPFYAGMKTTIEPLFGLRGGWIRQYFTVATTPATDDDSDLNQRAVLKSNSWSIGPKAGFQANWLFCHGFSLFGDLTAALLYTQYTTISVRNAAIGGLSSLGTHDGYVSLTPNIDTGLGVKWGSYFSDQGCYFDLSAAYNFSVFFSQNQSLSLNGVLQNVSTGSPGNLYLHGAQITTSFLF